MPADSAEIPVSISVDHSLIHGDLVLAESARAVVVFAHGSGSSRRSPRNREVASVLQNRGLGTLLLDLLTDDEEAVDLRTRELRFDIDLLAGRLVAAVEWLDRQAGPGRPPLAVGYFGASTGAAAAVVAAASQGDRVGAIVSRGGRPDLAGESLARVTAPTLLIVGGSDEIVHRLNLDASAHLSGECQLEVVAGATHLFEEPGALDQVAALAAAWFVNHLT